MNIEAIVKTICIITGILLIIAIALQPSETSGLIGDVSGVENRKRQGAELFFYRFTIIATIIFLASALIYGMGIGGAY